jgi:hypothetical protein
MEKIDNCGICLEFLNNDIELLPCSHIFHSKCIKILIESKCTSKYNCPICRHKLPLKDVKPIFSFPIIHALMFSQPFFSSDLFT